jgi:hypothetical protein
MRRIKSLIEIKTASHAKNERVDDGIVQPENT